MRCLRLIEGKRDGEDAIPFLIGDFLRQKGLIGYIQNIPKGAQFSRIDMPLADFHLGQGASGDVTVMGLESGGKLFLGQSLGFPDGANLPTHD